MFWITKSGPVSSTWISFGPAILCNTQGKGDSTQEVIFLDADTIHNNEQMMRLLVERISAFSGFGLALAGGLAAGRAGRRGSAEPPIDLCQRPSLPLTHHPSTHPSQTHIHHAGFFLLVELYILTRLDNLINCELKSSKI